MDFSLAQLDSELLNSVRGEALPSSALLCLSLTCSTAADLGWSLALSALQGLHPAGLLVLEDAGSAGHELDSSLCSHIYSISV